MITFLRRRRLGAGSLRGTTASIEGDNNTSRQTKSVSFWKGEKSSILINEKIDDHKDLLSSSNIVVRWGCTSATGVPLEKQVNTSEAIKETGDKRGFRKRVFENSPWLVPTSIFEMNHNTDFNEPYVLRPARHAQGKNLWVVNNIEELMNIVNSNANVFSNGWYASTLIDKAKEFRVYVGNGRVLTVAEKIPANENDVAWNVAQGGEFQVVKWGEWDLNACQVAIDSYNLSSLDFAGVDVMVDKSGKAYLIEINSAPSLPLLSNGDVSYRQSCMAKYFMWLAEQEHIHERHAIGLENNWRDYIHPAISDKARY